MDSIELLIQRAFKPGLTSTHTIDVERDLLPEERVAVGEGGTGSRADPDQYESESGDSGGDQTTNDGNGDPEEIDPAEQGRLNNDIGAAGERYRQNSTGGRGLQNGSGNGIDNYYRNEEGQLVFEEVKTSTSQNRSPSGDEAWGGERFVTDRLRRIRDGRSPFQGMSDDDIAEATRLLREIGRADSDDVIYQVVQQRANADTGDVGFYSSRTWNSTPGGELSWRNYTEPD